MFTSYIDLLYPTEDRNDRLRDSYFFTCECRECTTKDKVSSLMTDRGPRVSQLLASPDCLPTLGILALLTCAAKTGNPGRPRSDPLLSH